MIINRRSDLYEPCPNCDNKQWEIKKFVNMGGSTTYPYVCGVCGLRTQLYEKKKVVEGLCLELEEIEPKYSRHVCEVCGKEGAQNHHWAPSFLFGSKCNVWPQSYLCQECHLLWHNLVTPNMSKNKEQR